MGDMKLGGGYTGQGRGVPGERTGVNMIKIHVCMVCGYKVFPIGACV